MSSSSFPGLIGAGNGGGMPTVPKVSMVSVLSVPSTFAILDTIEKTASLLSENGNRLSNEASVE